MKNKYRLNDFIIWNFEKDKLINSDKNTQWVSEVEVRMGSLLTGKGHNLHMMEMYHLLQCIYYIRVVVVVISVHTFLKVIKLT